MPSAPDLLALHAVRLAGYTDAAGAAARFGLPVDDAGEHLLDAAARGWVTRVPTTDPPAWSLTDAGRAAGERALAGELAEVETRAPGAAAAVRSVYEEFGELNGRFLQACTRWQLRPVPGDPLAANEHDDWRWDARVIEDLGSLGRRLGPLEARLVAVLDRFAGYAARYASAFDRVERGEHGWVDGVGRDSCHAVWFELHEDLLATLGIARGTE